MIGKLGKRDQDELKFFFSNAPEDATIGQMLLVAFSRWRVERCFQDQKQDIGLNAWEGRRDVGLKWHLILSSVSDLFLARVRNKLRGKNSELTVSQVHDAVSALVQSWWLNGRASAALLEHTATTIAYTQQRHALARKCHARRRRKLLRQKGIKLTQIPHCKRGST